MDPCPSGQINAGSHFAQFTVVDSENSPQTPNVPCAYLDLSSARGVDQPATLWALGNPWHRDSEVADIDLLVEEIDLGQTESFIHLIYGHHWTYRTAYCGDSFASPSARRFKTSPEEILSRYEQQHGQDHHSYAAASLVTHHPPPAGSGNRRQVLSQTASSAT
jgi:hypothetical protein